MIMNMNEKGRQTKLLAAVAVLAMVVCALAIVMPSNVSGEEIPVAADGDIQAAIDQANAGDTIIISGTTYGNDDDGAGYTVYTVDKAITITSNNTTKPVIYGSFWVTADGVTINNLNINPYGNMTGDTNSTHKNGISFYGDEITVTNCEFNFREDSFANAICIFPKSDGALTLNIEKNEFNGFNEQSGNWETIAIVISDNFSAPRFGTGVVTGISGLSGDDLMALYGDNTFTDNAYAIALSNWNGGASSSDSGIFVLDTSFYCGENYVTYIPEDKTVTVNTASVNGTLYVYGELEATTISGDGTIYNFGKSAITGSNVVSAVETTASSAASMLGTDGVEAVFATSGSVGDITVPADKEFVIAGTTEVTGDITLAGAGSVVTVDGTSAAKSLSITNTVGTVKQSVAVDNVVGTVSVTYGSVNTVVTITSGSVTITGNGQGVPNIQNGTITGTIGAEAEVIIEAGASISVPDGETLTVDGKLTVRGFLDVRGSIVINGALDVTGTQGDVRFNDKDGITLGNDYVVNGVSTNREFGTSFDNHIYSTIQYATTTSGSNDTTFYIYGDYSATDSTTRGITVYLAVGASYDGRITYQIAGQNNTNAYSATVAGSVQNDSDNAVEIIDTTNGLKVTGLTVTSVSGGSIASDDTHEITLNGVTFQSMTLTTEVQISGVSTIPAGQTLTFGNGGKIVLAAGSAGTAGDDAANATKLKIYGSIARTTGVDTTGVIENKADYTIVYYTTQNFRDVQAVVSTDVTGSGASEYDHLRQMGVLILANSSQIHTDAYNFSGSVIVLGTDLVIEGSVTLNNVTIYTNGWNIYVGGDGADAQAGTLILNNSTIDRDYLPDGVIANSPDARESITIRSGSSMDVTDSLLFIEVNAVSGSSVDVDNEDVTYNSTTSEVRVGYGTTLYFSRTAVSSVNVYGTLVIDSTATLPSTNQFNVWSGASLVVNGSITALGDVCFYEGSDVTIANGGTFVLGDRNGGADMTVEGDLTVEEGATFTVTSTSNTAVAHNSLDAASTGDYAFTVLGTMTIGGYYTGAIHDQGTITFNGSVDVGDDAVIYVYDGVTLTVTSVSGSLTVSDYGIVDLEGIDETSDASYGNEVVLENVRGVTVSETVTSYPYIDENDENRIDYVANMYVSGTATTGGEGKITIDETGGDHSHDLVGEDGDLCASVIVSETLTLGKDVTIEVAGGELLVSGTITATTADSEGFPIPKFTVSGGELTVTGTVTIAEQGIEGDGGQINAVTYTVTGETETYTYTNFPAAVAAASGVDNYTITVMGNVSVTEDVTVPTGIIIEILNGDELTIAEDVTVIITAGATVNASGATIDVDGTMTSQDYEQDLNVGTIEADVVTTDGASRTWTSLANALANSSAGQTITANGPITIDADTTIPEGVTVYTEYTFTVDGATLTINGTLQMDDKAVSGDNDGLEVTDDADSEVIANGVLSIEYLQSAQNVYIGADLDGAHFTIRNGAYRTSYVSNVEFAAETASNNTNLEGNTVTIIGIVSAGDVTFASPDNLSLIVNIEQKAAAEGLTTEDRTTILTAGTITLEGNTALQIRDNNTRVTATVSALSGDGSETASIGLRNVYGTLYFSADAVETATGNEYEVSLNGEPSGEITISSGTVALNADLIISNGSTLTVESGAELVVADGTSLYGGTTERVDEPVVIDGTMTVQDEDALRGYIVVNGTLAADGVDISVGDSLTLRVTGDLTIEDGHELSIGNGYLFVGEKPQALGATTTGSVTGTVNFAAGSTGIILAYNGADLTGADIQLNAATGESEAASTAYYINEILYGTIYTVSSLQIGEIYDIDDGFDLNGIYVYGYWYETAAEAAAQSEALENVGMAQSGVEEDYIGDYASVYGAYINTGIPGQISVGTGMTLYIDGLMLNNYQVGDVYALSVGTHTVTLVANANYTIENATITFNGQTVENGGTITVDADAVSFSLVASGASPTDNTVVIDGGNGSSDMGLTDYLLIVLVILIVIMAIIVALRLMRS